MPKLVEGNEEVRMLKNKFKEKFKFKKMLLLLEGWR